MQEEVFQVITAVNRLKEKISDLSSKIGEIQRTLPYVPREYWNEQEACEYLKIGRRSLFKLKAAKKISYIKSNRTILFRPCDLDEYLEKFCLIKSLEKKP